jgi:hypothetical protein
MTDDTRRGEFGNVRDALDFARQLAKEEIDSIERIHRRTLASFGYIGIVAASLAAIFGYIGFNNLKKAAVLTAQTQMQDEVTKQVKDKLTKERVEDIVRAQVHDLSATALTEAIRKELSAPPLSTSIRGAAADEARRQIKVQFTPRHFSEAQSKAFVKAVSERHELDGYPVAIQTGFSFESERYAVELEASAELAKLKIVIVAGVSKLPTTGLTIYRDEASPEIYARALQEALAESGLGVRIISGPPFQPVKKGELSPLILYVGPKQNE